MRLRLLAAAAAAATLPLGAPPASAHDLCWASAEQPFTASGSQIWGPGGTHCWSEVHSNIELTICLQYALVDVPELYADRYCETGTYAGPFANVGSYVFRYCPIDTGFYRTRAHSTMDGHDEPLDDVSASALIVARCTV